MGAWVGERGPMIWRKIRTVVWRVERRGGEERTLKFGTRILCSGSYVDRIPLTGAFCEMKGKKRCNLHLVLLEYRDLIL